MSRITKGSSNLGKIALDYGMKIKTLVSLIEAYPLLIDEVRKHTDNCRMKGQKTLPPVTVNNIYATLGEP